MGSRNGKPRLAGRGFLRWHNSPGRRPDSKGTPKNPRFAPQAHPRNPFQREAAMLLVHVTSYMRVRFGRVEHVVRHTRRWPRT